MGHRTQETRNASKIQQTMEPGAQPCTSELLLCCAVVLLCMRRYKKKKEAKTNPGSDEKPTQLAWEFKGGFQGTKVDRREEKKQEGAIQSRM